MNYDARLFKELGMSENDFRIFCIWRKKGYLRFGDKTHFEEFESKLFDNLYSTREKEDKYKTGVGRRVLLNCVRKFSQQKRKGMLFNLDSVECFLKHKLIRETNQDIAAIVAESEVLSYIYKQAPSERSREVLLEWWENIMTGKIDTKICNYGRSVLKRLKGGSLKKNDK